MSQVAPASVHKLPALTYAEDALEPVISRRTVEFHGKSAMSAAASTRSGAIASRPNTLNAAAAWTLSAVVDRLATAIAGAERQVSARDAASVMNSANELVLTAAELLPDLSRPDAGQAASAGRMPDNDSNEVHTGETAMPTADPQGVRETPLNTDPAPRASDQPGRDQGDFPIWLIPLVPLLGVLIAFDTYLIVGMLL
jgi:hypothetical protein